ncbi:lipopolysaccharide biosynthesis protein [Thiocapsa marina]|uniref:Polysaccharide biosynthesis protein n=1 Tax=Thiocapsa marina 5811 TaxID=768671 RepID=F9U6B3_9GAMM|nr:oligosaccharide flippase family protein [Thiocapsa marina]EGV20686.1 polysaccharide biosynthesis protein [Thiocapsa marina 5811]
MLKRNLIANYLGQGWTTLINLIFIPVYIHYLGIEAYGLIGMFGVLIVWLSLLDLGMKPTLSRELALFTGGAYTVEAIRDLLRSVEFLAVTIAVLIALGIGSSATWIASEWLNTENIPTATVAQSIAIMGLVTALRFVEGIYASSLVGLQRQMMLNLIKSGMATIGAVGAIFILALVSPTLQAFFAWQGIVSIATLLILAVSTYSSLPKSGRCARFSVKSLQRIRRYASGVLGIAFLGILLTQIDKVILSKLLSLSDYGYYTIAAVVAGSLFTLVGPITQAWFPRLSQYHAQGDEDALAESFHLGAQMITIILGSVSLVLIAHSNTILQLWTRNSELAEDAAVLVSLLAFGNLLNGLCHLPYHAQLAHGWTELGVRSNAIGVGIIVPAIILVVPHYGAVGAAAVWIALNVGYVVIIPQYMYERILIGQKKRWYLDDLLYPLLAATFAVTFLTLTMRMGDSAAVQFAELLFTIVVATLSAILAADKVRPIVWKAICTNIRARKCVIG